MADDLISTSEMAAQVHRSRYTIDRWLREGRIPHRTITVGKQVRYQVRRSDWAAFVRRYVGGDW